MPILITPKIQRLWLLGWLALILGCSTPSKTVVAPSNYLPGDPAAPSQVTPAEALAIAEMYAEHPWKPFARNILHGLDHRKIRVDTPDIGHRPGTDRDGWWIPGEINLGIPYKWGGFDDPTTFDRKIAEGSAGGDVSTPEKRRADNAAVSDEATGVDCSGFVSRCLKIPVAYDSSQLPSVCDPIADARFLAPGDLLNIPRQHVLLFAGWARPDHTWIYFYETGGIPNWKPALKEAPLEKLLALGYQLLRYRGMARESAPSDKEILTRALRRQAVKISDPVVGDP